MISHDLGMEFSKGQALRDGNRRARRREGERGRGRAGERESGGEDEQGQET